MATQSLKGEEVFSNFRMEAFQAEGVGDHGHGAHGHGRGSNHGVKKDTPEGVEDSRSNWNAQDVVNEGPKEILFNRADRSPA